MKNRILSLLLCMIMLLSLCPASFAEEFFLETEDFSETDFFSGEDFSFSGFAEEGTVSFTDSDAFFLPDEEEFFLDDTEEQDNVIFDLSDSDVFFCPECGAKLNSEGVCPECSGLDEIISCEADDAFILDDESDEDDIFCPECGEMLEHGVCPKCSADAAKLNDTSNASFTKLVVGSNKFPVSADDYEYVSFIPSQTGTYKFYTTGSLDTLGRLLDVNDNLLVKDDDSGTDKNFSFSYNLTAGNIYYVGATLFSGSRTTVPLIVEFTGSTVTVGKVTGVTLTSTVNGMSVKWNAVEGADGYQVWRKVYGSSASFTRVATVTENSCVDSGTVAGTSYTYKVRAYKTVSGTNKFGSYSGTVARRFLARTEITGIGPSGSSIRLTWSKCEGANGYRVFCKAPGDTAYTKITDVSGTTLTYTHSGVTAGQKYSYKVRAFYKNDNGCWSYGPLSAIKSWTPLKMSATSKSGAVGSTVSLSVTGGTGTITWKSSNTSVATVSGGKVTLKAAGTATITATRNGVSVTCTVTVTGSKISTSSVNMYVGNRVKLAVSNTGTSTVTWSSGNTSVARVDSTGVVTAVGLGECSVTASVSGKTFVCKVTTAYPNITFQNMGIVVDTTSGTTQYSNRYQVVNNSGSAITFQSPSMIFYPNGASGGQASMYLRGTIDGAYISASNPVTVAGGSSRYMFGYFGSSYYSSSSSSYTAFYMVMNGNTFIVLVTNAGAINSMQLYEG